MKKLILLVSLLSFSMHSQNVTVNSGRSFTIQSTSSLTVGGNFTNTAGTVTLNSSSDEFSSLLVSGASSGDITYNRYVNIVGTGDWDLVGAPVSGMAFSELIIDPNIATNGSGVYAVGAYDNSLDTWTNATNATTGDLALGQGYQMATTNGGTLSFTGAIANGDQSVIINNNNAANSGSGRRWNLIANPFASYLHGNTNADGTNNFLTVNTAAIDDNFEAIYGWKADGTGYEIYNNSSTTTYIAPGQGFFVAAAGSGADQTISFTQAMQTVTGADDFISGRIMNPTSSEFLLKLYEDEILIDNTRFYFDNDLTLGLDPGYDAGHFNQDASLMSRLVEEDEGIGFAINAMGSDALGGVSIPLEVNQLSNVPFRISLEDSSIAPDIEVQLEDRLLETLTLLNDEDFTLTAEDDLIGIGRFYLHLGNVTLGVNDPEDSYVRVYKPNNSDYIAIEGLVNIQKARIKLYNLIGQEIIHKVLSNNQTNYRISTQGIPQGVYVIKLQFENSKITKKLIIN